MGSWQRTTAAACAIFVAVASFVILTGTVTTQRLQVTQTVANNYRSTYDILVRPRGAAGPLEQSADLVRPNFLAGSYGGIRMEQVQQIATVPGVDVAAPVAVLGQTMRNILIPVDVGAVLKVKDRAMVRYSLNGSSRNGTARTSNQHGYLDPTRSPLTTLDPPPDGPPDAVAGIGGEACRFHCHRLPTYQSERRRRRARRTHSWSSAGVPARWPAAVRGSRSCSASRSPSRPSTPWLKRS